MLLSDLLYWRWIIHSPVLRKQSSVEELKLPCSNKLQHLVTSSLMLVNVMQECTRVVLGGAWLITAIYRVSQLLQGLNSQCF